MRLFDLLKRNASGIGEETFLFSESESISYERADLITDKISGGLLSLGIERGDRIAIFSPNSINYVLAMFGIFKAGGIASLIDVSDAGKLSEHIKNIEPKILFFSPKFSKVIEERRQEMPDVDNYICLEDGAGLCTDWSKFVSRSPARIDESLPDDAPCYLSFTSGTTYRPKPVVLSHEPTSRATNCIAERLALSPDDTTLGVTSLSNSHILVYGLLPQMHRGIKIGIMEKWSPTKAWEMVANHKVKVVSGKAVLLSEMIDTAKDKGLEKGSLRIVISGGSPAYTNLKRKWREFGVPLVETLGQSELGGAVAMGCPYPYKSKRVEPFDAIPPIGPPLPDKEVRIVDSGDNELPIGTPGEIVIRGGYMWGYWKMKEETEQALRNGWLHTNDIGYIDKHNNVYWLARKTDIIESGGYTIYPRMIEETLYNHPEVRKVAVIGLPDEKLGEIPGAFVILRPDSTTTENELMKYCQSKLPKYYLPKKIEIRKILPMTGGKINKKKLRSEVFSD